MDKKIQQIETSLNNDDNYGLDNPEITITLRDSTEDDKTIYIGNINEITGNYYCYLEGDSMIYTISSTIPSYISFDLEDMKDPTSGCLFAISFYLFCYKFIIFKIIYLH